MVACLGKESKKKKIYVYSTYICIKYVCVYIYKLFYFAVHLGLAQLCESTIFQKFFKKLLLHVMMENNIKRYICMTELPYYTAEFGTTL